MEKKGRKIRILVVDDSAFMRHRIGAILASDPGLMVIGEAQDGLEAVNKAFSLKPDLITMDIAMPVLDGLEAIGKIMEKEPLPILALTSLSGVRTAFSAVSRGALDVFEKSDMDLEDGARLIRRIKMLADVDVAVHQIAMRKPEKPGSEMEKLKRGEWKEKKGPVRIIAMASSTGGPQALSAIFSGLPADFPIPIVVAQHVALGFTEGMAQWLDSCTSLRVLPAANGEILKPGHVYLNPAECRMRVSPEGSLRLQEERESRYHPCCDRLLESVAESFGAAAVGIILSGMGDDGVAGLACIQEEGGLTLAQSEESSVIFGMNGLAIQRGVVQKVFSPGGITAFLLHLAQKNRGKGW
jgi:two-component system chemotaxis response regulator CheB